MPTERLWCHAGEHWYKRQLRRGPKPRSCREHPSLAPRRKRKRKRDVAHLWGAYLVAWEAWIHASEDPFVETRERLVAKELADALLVELLDTVNPAIRGAILERAGTGSEVPFRRRALPGDVEGL